MGEENKKFQEIQILEQNFQGLFYQKQAFQMEVSETKAALKELENSGDETFKIVGQLMLKTDKGRIKKELLDKEKILDNRIEGIEKQEKELMEKLDNLKKEVENTKKN